MGNIDITQVVKYENQILTWTLVGILVIMLLAFLRGIFRGWRYGTYRLGYFLILIIIGLACLGPIANAVSSKVKLRGPGVISPTCLKSLPAILKLCICCVHYNR